MVSKLMHRCRHVVETPGDLVELDGCGNCGVVQKTNWCGQTTKRDPCPDCIANGVWIKVEGKWEKAAS